MRVYWHNGSLKFKPETRADAAALNKLQEFFGGIGLPVHDDFLLPLEKELGRLSLDRGRDVVEVVEVSAHVDSGND
jgi:hypothetical protein